MRGGRAIPGRRPRLRRRSPAAGARLPRGLPAPGEETRRRSRSLLPRHQRRARQGANSGGRLRLPSDAGARVRRRRGGRQVRQRAAPRHHATQHPGGAAHGVPAHGDRRHHLAQAQLHFHTGLGLACATTFKFRYVSFFRYRFAT